MLHAAPVAPARRPEPVATLWYRRRPGAAPGRGWGWLCVGGGRNGVSGSKSSSHTAHRRGGGAPARRRPPLVLEPSMTLGGGVVYTVAEWRCRCCSGCRGTRTAATLATTATGQKSRCNTRHPPTPARPSCKHITLHVVPYILHPWYQQGCPRCVAVVWHRRRAATTAGAGIGGRVLVVTICWRGNLIQQQQQQQQHVGPGRRGDVASIRGLRVHCR